MGQSQAVKIDFRRSRILTPVANGPTAGIGVTTPCALSTTVDPYEAITVMTAASTVLAKSVRFPEHVSPGCCTRIASIVPVPYRYLGPRECVHIKLLVSSVSFSHNNVLTQSLLTVRLAVSEIKGNVVAYKDLNLVTITIKRYFSREHSERM